MSRKNQSRHILLIREILIDIKGDNNLEYVKCQSIITLLNLFFFHQLHKIFSKYAKESPNLGMTPAEFAEFLHREQGVNLKKYFNI